ncbi:MAG: BrnT family toxin [Ruminococcus sp.]|nr:BrnT family toxin [Ruminococcus sp.]
MLFEWDDEKNQINIKKHGIDFETAARVFADENRLELFDELYSDFEDRYITIGMINNVAYIVMVVYTERDNAIRLISARKATNQERRMYYDYSQGN